MPAACTANVGKVSCIVNHVLAVSAAGRTLDLYVCMYVCMCLCACGSVCMCIHATYT